MLGVQNTSAAAFNTQKRKKTSVFTDEIADSELPSSYFNYCACNTARQRAIPTRCKSYLIAKVLLDVSHPTVSLSKIFARLGMSTEEPDIASVASVSLAKPANVRPKKKAGIFTDGKYGQDVDSDINYKASLYVGRKCEMTFFEPNALPAKLLEGLQPLVNRQNVVNSFEYEADLLIVEGCWRKSQTPGFPSYLDAPPAGDPPSKVMVKRRAMAVLFDLFCDPPKEWLSQTETD